MPTVLLNLTDPVPADKKCDGQNINTPDVAATTTVQQSQ